MGLYSSSRRSSARYSPALVPQGQPNPKEWLLLREYRFDNAIVVMIRYSGVKNYEGTKVLVYAKRALYEVTKANGGELDPHFSDDATKVSPIARFEPTETGWAMACDLAKTIKLGGNHG